MLEVKDLLMFITSYDGNCNQVNKFYTYPWFLRGWKGLVSETTIN